MPLQQLLGDLTRQVRLRSAEVFASSAENRLDESVLKYSKTWVVLGRYLEKLIPSFFVQKHILKSGSIAIYFPAKYANLWLGIRKNKMNTTLFLGNCVQMP